MRTYSKDFSIIIPIWRGAIKFLPKLLTSIPEKEGIEIIVVDNSKEPVKREEIDCAREIIFLHSDYERHAGGSRNDGMSIAKGKWLIFADADDYFTSDAFDIYYSMLETDAEIVYTGMGGVYEDTGEPTDRGQCYAKIVHSYCMGEVDELKLRLGFASPCCKMISHKLVDCYNLRYDEIKAGNDVYFSLTIGYYAKKVDAVDKITYMATINRGSLTQRKDYEVIKARLYSKLHCNQFLRNHGLSKYQGSVMFAFYESRHYGISKIWEFLMMCIKFKQNIFIGWRNWYNTFFKVKDNELKNKKYIVR